MDSEKAKKTILVAGALLVFIGAYIILEGTFSGYFPELNAQTSIMLVFIIGMLTSFHCIAMCGGFVVSYSTKNKEGSNTEKKKPSLKSKANIFSHLQYAGGKLISYGAMGALFGLLGSFIVFTPQLRGFAAIIAGFFLLVFGINQLGIFSQLRKISLPVPKAVTRFVVSNRKRGPFFVGLANGLMIACGPLQAMYIFAASTGSALAGMRIMLAFGLGTLPLMIFFGLFVSLVSGQLTQKILRFSGVIVIVLGLMLFANGFALAGIALPALQFSSVAADTTAVGNNSVVTGNGAPAAAAVQEIRMEVNAYGYSPSNFTIKQGVPVKWIINVTKLTGCNNEILVPVLGIQKKLALGEQTIEFTPDKLGTIQFSCWMGMIRGSFTVVANGSGAVVANAAAQGAATQNTATYPQNQGTPKGCGCGGAK